MGGAYYYIAFRKLDLFDQWGTRNVDQEICREDWIGFVEKNRDRLTWYENTESGRLVALGKDPSSVTHLDKRVAKGEFDKKTGCYKFILQYSRYEVGITFDGMRSNKRCLLLCYELAIAMGAKLFKNKTAMRKEMIEEM